MIAQARSAMQNVEMKAELRDLPLARAIAPSVGCKFVETLEQTDTYFRLADGRLKRRETEGERYPPEWIFYHRDNLARPRLSRFAIYTENQAHERFGRHLLPVWVIVHKVRDVWVWGTASVRVHLDTVDRLGTFIEFEALVSPQFSVAKAHAALAELRRAFAPAMGEPLALGYADLIARESETAER